jgi:acyl carrier protein
MRTVADILKEIRPECDFAVSADFFADGMLDSFDIITLVSELDKTYSISIDGIEITPENFCSLAAIRALLDHYGVRA